MKIAIIGAGLSGMCCAHELKRHGIVPTIFEKGSYIGGKLDFPVIQLKMFNVPHRDVAKQLKKNYNIDIQPIRPLKQITLKAPSKTLTVRGNLGNIFLRPPYAESIDNQIAQKVRPDVIFDTYVKAKEINKEFDYVIVATASPRDAWDLNLFTPKFNSHVRIATVLGEFKTDTVQLWFNTEYAKNGYAYLVPIGPREARMALIVDNTSHRQLDFYWKKFLEMEELEYTVLTVRDIEHQAGFVYPVQTENILLAGNAGGFMDDFLGFGSMRAIVSGVTAARSIIRNLDYTKEMEPFISDIRKKHAFREAMNMLDNRGFDRLVAFMGLPLIKQYIYKNPFFHITQSVPLIRRYNRLKSK